MEGTREQLEGGEGKETVSIIVATMLDSWIKIKPSILNVLYALETSSPMLTLDPFHGSETSIIQTSSVQIPSCSCSHITHHTSRVKSPPPTRPTYSLTFFTYYT